MSLSIAKVVLAKGYSVIYGSAPDLFRKAEQEHFGREDGNTVEMLLVIYPVSWILTAAVFTVVYLRGNWLRSRIRACGLEPETK